MMITALHPLVPISLLRRIMFPFMSRLDLVGASSNLMIFVNKVTKSHSRFSIEAPYHIQFSYSVFVALQEARVSVGRSHESRQNAV
jgi:hypothetical protein